MEKSKSVGIRKPKKVLSLAGIGNEWTNEDNLKDFWRGKISSYLPEDKKESLTNEFYQLVSIA